MVGSPCYMGVSENVIYIYPLFMAILVGKMMIKNKFREAYVQTCSDADMILSIVIIIHFPWYTY
jgi:hypothetical protein